MSDETPVEPVLQAPVDPKAEWQKICQESKGSRILLSGDMESKAREFQAKRLEFEKAAQVFAKLSSEFDHEKETYFFTLRQDLETNGIIPFPWEIRIGFEEQAKKDDVMVLNISE